MSAVHTVTVQADPDDGTPSWFGLTFACSGGPEDTCRQWCAEGCEEECFRYGEHRWAPLNPPYYRVVEWLDAVGSEETYAGDDESLRVGTHRIEEEWTGDDYLWRYAELAPRVSDAGVPL